jgi:hypothetical protein
MNETASMHPHIMRPATPEPRFSDAIRRDDGCPSTCHSKTAPVAGSADYAPMRRAAASALTPSVIRLRIRTESAFNPAREPWERSRAGGGDEGAEFHHRCLSPMPHVDTLRERATWITQMLG